MTPTSIIDLRKVEKLLIANWTSFIESHKLIALVLSCVRDSDLQPLYQDPPVNVSGIQITISDLTLTENKNNGVMWIDFIIPKANQVAIGTCEMTFNLVTGLISPLRVVGNLFHST